MAPRARPGHRELPATTSPVRLLSRAGPAGRVGSRLAALSEPRGGARAARSAPQATMAGPGERSSRGEPSGRGRWKSLKRSRVWLLAGAAGLAVGVVVVTVGALLLGGSGPAHALVTPAKLGA